VFLFGRDDLVARSERAFAREREVRFQDVDAAGIVFYVRFFDYFHDVWADFLRASGEPLDRALRDGRWGAPLRHAEADYFKPLRFGDPIEVSIVRAHVEPTEVTVGYRIGRPDGETVAVGQTVHTFIDPGRFRRSEMPGTLREAFGRIG
jgi:YbgC/YbaW family acyl-CoA thioester hydrolase